MRGRKGGRREGSNILRVGAKRTRVEGKVEWDMAPHHLCLWTSSNSGEARAREANT